ncbi:hypothetical protein EsH8_X_000445 [Colletotrichum jinshuiense]
MSTNNTAQQALEEAQQAFRMKIRNSSMYDEVLTTTTVDDVYKAISEIQAKIASKGKLRYLGKIRPFLDRLSEYASTIEVFVQAKPEVLALLWGPIKMILLWSSAVNDVLDKMADALASIGIVLPQFALLAKTFEASDVVKAALSLFYEDILDFYGITIDFFRKTGYRKKVDIVIENLQKHSLLMRNEVTILDITEARKARVRSSLHFMQAEAHQQRQKYQGLKSRMSPNLHDDRLDQLRNRCVPDCGTWLFRDEKFCEWLDDSNKTAVWLWLQGIPGAGKTYLTAAAINYMKDQHRTLFVFADHANQSKLSALSVVQSLIFQAAEDDKSLQSLLVESKERELRGNTGYAVDLLKMFLMTAGPVYVIIDGLDEIEEFERQILLQRLEDVSKSCGDLRIMISSRAEDDISRVLQPNATSIRVDEKNAGGIQTYVDSRCKNWIATQQFNRETRLEVLGFISPLSAKANGKFKFPFNDRPESYG